MSHPGWAMGNEPRLLIMASMVIVSRLSELHNPFGTEFVVLANIRNPNAPYPTRNISKFPPDPPGLPRPNPKRGPIQ
jgi:hypothetical protein